jgi:hypothetical protein
MPRWYPGATSHPLLRTLWLYGLYTLIANAFFLIGFYLLPEGALRRGPQVAAARVAADAGGFGSELALTLLFNVGVVVVIAVVLNLNRVKGFPVGYLYPIVLGVVSGLIPGTNSFVSSDLAAVPVREGLALSLSIGNLEMLGYICVIAATVPLGIYEYRSWWRWTGEWKDTRTKPLREVRLTRGEWLLAAAGLALVVIAAVRETMLAHGTL